MCRQGTSGKGLSAAIRSGASLQLIVDSRCGLGMPDKCHPSVLQGDGGDAVGSAYPLGACAPLPLWIRGRVVGGAFDLFAICEYNTRHD